ncbi:E3 ubiquitin-protein ligase UPL3 isoform X1 [Cryptomeria japonica]|uniref:E3 ubiquitin-protein ligase UPL3 isoform X1 n=1 Tax=Cryptomeria japonica TaxID=3369 RepID=UPI0027D9E526|nr:E3 ubiquitin-protein ligase UPL3 isoform X1 [Cryptomeria japonica]
MERFSEDFLLGSSNSQLQSMLCTLQDKEADDITQIAALTNLCEILAMASEEFHVDSFIPILVGYLKQGNPEIKLLATRSLTYISDIFPWYCSNVVFEGAIPAMCEHLLTSYYLDLAEESVLALEKISRRRASNCLRDGAFMALLLNLDFFSSAIKKHALSTAANISLELSPSTIGLVIEEVPILLGVLSDPDAKMVEHACVCLSQIARAAAASQKNLEEISNYGLVAKAISLISVTNSVSGQASLSSPGFMAVIGLLSTCASASAVLAGQMIEMGISSILRDILNAGIVSQMTIPVFSNDSTNQLQKIVSFVNDLLPSVSNEKISLPTSDERDDRDNSAREKLFQEKPELLVQFGMNLFQLMIQIYGSSINAQVCRQCLKVISKLLYLSTPEILKPLLQETNISRFLAGILSGKDFEISLAALQMGEILIQKLPDIMFNMFMREGVFYAVGTLISTGSTVSGEDKTYTTWNTWSESEEESEEESEANQIEEIVSAHARQFKATYFVSNSGARATKGFRKLTNLCKKLDWVLCDLMGKSMKAKQSRVVYNSHYGLNGKFEGKAKQGMGISKRKSKRSCAVSYNNEIPSIIANILAELCQDDGVSTFEFVKSGVVASFLNYFAGRDLKRDKMIKADSIGHQLETIKRLETFVDISLPLIVHGKESPLTVLVRKLQDALSSEDFPIQLSQGPRSDNNDPLKVRLCRAQEERCLSSHPRNILYVEPFARIADIEDYLCRRLQINKTEITCTSSVAEPRTHVTTTEAAAEEISSARSRPSTTTENSTNSTPSKAGESVSSSVTADFNDTQIRIGVSMGDALEREPQLKHEQGGSIDEGLLEEPTSVCVMDGANGVLLRDPADASGIEAGVPTIRASSICSKGSSRSREHPRLNFFIGGKLLDRSSTVYEAIQKSVQVEGDDPSHSDSEWINESIQDKVHKIRYKKTNTPRERNLTETHQMYATLMKLKNLRCIDKVLQGTLLYNIGEKDSTNDILLLLQILDEINKLAPCLRANSLSDAFAKGRLKSLDELKANGPTVPQREFFSGKLTPKLAYLLKDAEALATFGLPNWCNQLIENCPFLFPFEIRRQYFMFCASHKIPPDPYLRNNDAVRLPRLKVRVSRKRVLKAAAQVMHLCRGQKAALEIQYYNEVGSGLGPTLEFYTLISHELQSSKIGMWRTNAEESVQASLGLFPRPYSLHTESSDREKFQVIENFILLGFLMAKALQDGRLLDLPLSRAFYKLLLGNDLDLYDIKYFDIGLGTILQEMQALAARRQYLESMADDKSKEISSLHYRGAKIEDLCFDFTLPGFPDYPLKAGGSSIMVTIDNIDEYVSLAVDATIASGIMPQIEALRKGFNQVFPISTLQVFSEKELETLICGERDLWEQAEMLCDHIKFDHGYTAQCPFALDFLEIVAAFTPKLQRAFLQFVTGSPNLPPGGLSALNPKLTVVSKNPLNLTEAVAMDLPSAMTCANYLKLPPYSTKETMRDRLVYAITEGQGSFDLS